MSQRKYYLYFVMIALAGILVVVFVFQAVLQNPPQAAQAPEAADVAVIGGDTAAVLSALEAAQEGAHVVLFPEGQEIAFDISFLVSGGLAAASTPIQEEMGITFPPRQLRETIADRGGEMSKPSLLNSFTESSTRFHGRAKEYGVKFDKLPKPQEKPYWHTASSLLEGQVFQENLQQELKRSPVFKRGESVKEFILDEGEVVGLWLENNKGDIYPFYSQAAIIGGGGYSAEVPSWHQHIYPDNLIDLRPEQEGRGLHLANKIDVDFVQMGFLNKQLLLYAPEGEEHFSLPMHIFENPLLLNSAGHYLEEEELQEEKGANFALRSAPSKTYIAISHEELAREELEEKGDEKYWEEIAPLFTEVESWKAAGEKFGFDRIPQVGETLTSPYLIAEVKAGVNYTLGGISITPQGEVLRNGRVVKGLYAAGEVVGGLHGENMLEGMPLSETFFTSEAAGKTAAAYASR